MKPWESVQAQSAYIFDVAFVCRVYGSANHQTVQLFIYELIEEGLWSERRRDRMARGIAKTTSRRHRRRPGLVTLSCLDRLFVWTRACLHTKQKERRTKEELVKTGPSGYKNQFAVLGPNDGLCSY